MNADDTDADGSRAQFDEPIEINEICHAILNSEIKEPEINDNIKLLKNNKAAGYNKMVNEYLKVVSPRLTKKLL